MPRAHDLLRLRLNPMQGPEPLHRRGPFRLDRCAPDRFTLSVGPVSLRLEGETLVDLRRFLDEAETERARLDLWQGDAWQQIFGDPSAD